MNFSSLPKASIPKEARERLERHFLSMAGRHELARASEFSTGKNIMFHGDHHAGSMSERERRALFDGSWVGSWAKAMPEIERVIFNDPATIVIFKNGEKIVVKRTEDDEYNPEAGLAMAIAKKYMGSRTAFKKLVKENGGCSTEVQNG